MFETFSPARNISVLAGILYQHTAYRVAVPIDPITSQECSIFKWLLCAFPGSLSGPRWEDLLAQLLWKQFCSYWSKHRRLWCSMELRVTLLSVWMFLMQILFACEASTPDNNVDDGEWS